MKKTSTSKKEVGEIKANIMIKQLVMDQLFEWKFKMIVGKELKVAYQRYTVRMVFNEERYLDKIERIKKEDTLVPAVQKKEIAEIRSEMEDQRELCPDIEFIATVNQVKYGFGKTELLVGLPDDIIEEINQHKRSMEDNYVAKLIPLEGESKDE